MRVRVDTGVVGTALILTAETPHDGWLLAEMEADGVGVVTTSADTGSVESLVVLNVKGVK